jgi:hypothetical protein
MTFGNINDESFEVLFSEMRKKFPTEESCFVNKNYKLFQKYIKDNSLVRREDSLALVQETGFGPLSNFFRLYYK